MLSSGLLDFLPLGGLFGAIIAVVFLSIEAGYRLGRFRRRKSAEEKEAPVGEIIAATLGLLAFILAFTFGMAASRFDERRKIVVDEANAIGTTYLRAGLLPDGRGPNVRKLLRDYVDARLEFLRTKDVNGLLLNSEKLHRDLWREAEAVGGKHPDSIVIGLFIQALNETIDIHSKRVLVGLQSRLPQVLWTTLYLVTILTMAGVGYHEGLSKSRRSWAVAVLIVAFSAIMTLIADLDRPQEGLVVVSQQAMIDLRKTMNETP